MHRARPLVCLLTIVAIACLAGACGPEEGANNDTQNGTNQNTTNQNTTNQNTNNQNAENWNADYLEVAEIVRTTCAVDTCHGNNPDSETPLEFGASGDDLSLEELQFVLDEFESYDFPLVTPGNSDESQIYIVISGQDEEFEMPPPPLSMDQEDIDTIRDWIDDGANYE